MLMCYLRVCPFTKAIGQDCTIEKKPDQCCPVITCPEGICLSHIITILQPKYFCLFYSNQITYEWSCVDRVILKDNLI